MSPALLTFEYGLSGEMAGAAQGDRAARHAGCGPARCRHRQPGSASWARSSRWRRLSGWSYARSTCTMQARSSARSRRSPAAPNSGMILTASAFALRSSQSDHHAGSPAQAASGLLSTRFRRRRRPDLLWARPSRPVSARGRLCRSHPQGREAGRPAGAGADQVRAGDQPQDRQGARPDVPPTLLARADEVIE